VTASLSAADARAIARSLARHGYLRRTTLSAGRRGARREWLYFCVGGDGFDLIVNLSTVDDLRPAATGERVRLTVLVRDGERWDGDVDEIAAELAGGALHARFPGGEIALRDGALRVTAALRRRPIALDLRITPAAFPSLVNNVALAAGQAIHWLVVPRAIADGWFEIADRRTQVAGASAYHDHNWGEFTHRDFGWTWGHAVSDAASQPTAIVLTRMVDGAQAASYLQALLVWRGARLQRVFRGDDLAIEPIGWLRPTRCFTVPRVGALLAGGTVTEVPQRLRLHAACDGDELHGEFVAHDVARIALPNDHDLGTTLIHEVAGRLQMSGSIQGAPLAIDARAVFELLRREP